MAVRVVIVDDHEAFRISARKLLEQGGFAVVGEAGDGASGLELVRSLEPEVVLLDVVLPDMSGFDLAEHLANKPPKVVLVSSRERSDFGPRIDQCHATGFISKDRLSNAVLRAMLEAA